MEIAHSLEGPDHVIRTQEGIVLRFSRLHENHEDITGLCRISLVGFPGWADGDVYDSKLILTGPRSKADAAKVCHERVGEFGGWLNLIEGACKRVRHELEEGSPIIYIDDSGEDEPAPPYAVEPFIREQESTLLFGLGGTAKSSMALTWAASAQGNVLYIDYEDEDKTIRRRLRSLIRGGSLPGGARIGYKRADTSLPQMCDALARQIAAEHICGIVIDSAGLACGAEPERAESANAYFRALRCLGTQWSLTIAHQTKLETTYPFGSVYWWNNPRSIWQSRTNSEEGATDLHIGLWHRKNNNGPLSPAIGYHVSYREGTVQLHREPPRVYFRDHVTQDDKVLATMEDTPTSGWLHKELSDEAGIPERSLYVVMTRLGKRGVVRKDETGRYRLVHEDSPVPSPTPYWAE